MTRLTRRAFLRLAAGTAATTALTACGAAPTATPTRAPEKPIAPTATTAAPTPTKAPTAAPTGKPMKLLFPSWQQDEPGSSDWFKARIADFTKAHPEVTIEFTKVGLGDHQNKLLVQFAAKSPSHIIHLPYTNLIQFADQGVLEPLDDWMKETDYMQVWSPLRKATEWKGKTYAIQLLAYGQAMVYNEKLLKDAGVEVPKTAPDMVKAIKATTKKPDQFGFGTVTVPGYNMFTYIGSWLIGNGGKWLIDGKPTVTTPEAIEAFGWWADVVRSGGSPTSMESGPLRQLLQQGKMAMWFDGPWGQGFIKAAAAEVRPNLKVARLPLKKIIGGLSNVIGMAKDLSADEKKMTWEFLKTLITKDSQQDYSIKYCVATSRTDAKPDSAKLHESCPLIDPWIEAMNSPDLADIFPFGMETKTVELSKIVSEFGQLLIISPNASIKDEAEKLQKRMEDLQKS